MIVDISFEGGKKVAATFPDGLKMLTDQSVENGGEGSYPEPYASFLGAIGTCAGVYVLEFCNARRIPAENVSLTQTALFREDENGKNRLAQVVLTINLPSDFPERYRKAVVKAAGLCSVKKAILNPPEFLIDYQVI